MFQKIWLDSMFIIGGYQINQLDFETCAIYIDISYQFLNGLVENFINTNHISH